jgi:hypothetical protein
MAMAKARAQIEEKRRLAEERRKATNGEQVRRAILATVMRGARQLGAIFSVATLSA